MNSFEWSNERLNAICPIQIPKSNDKCIGKKINKEYISEWQKNTLFWHIYSSLYSNDKSRFFGNKTQIENEEKFKWIDIIQSNRNKEEIKKIIKKHKLKVDDCINDLASSKSISIETCILVFVCLNIPVIMIRNKIAFIFIESSSYKLLNISDNTMYHKDVTIDYIKDKYIIGYNIHKPLLSISSYKLNELKEMYSVIECDTNEKPNKANLYNKIMKYIYE